MCTPVRGRREGDDAEGDDATASSTKAVAHFALVVQVLRMR
jgi:hypothetical protein